MSKDPVFAVKQYHEGKHAYRITVKGGLNYIRGNNKPYFSITADIDVASGGRWREESGGCLHDEIAKHFPNRFDDLIAMHLSDIDGTPMHFVSNAWYDLAGALGGCGEQYHVGNSERHMPKFEIDPAKPWATTDYRKPTETECLEIFARHCRISFDEALKIHDDIRAEITFPNYEGAPTKGDYNRARAKWLAIAPTMLERFKREADECIARHSLVVYGDAWGAK